MSLELGSAALASPWTQKGTLPEAEAAPSVQQVSEDIDPHEQEFGAHIDAVAGQVGLMQAEILRLNALGERLVKMADLDEQEFDFHNPHRRAAQTQTLPTAPPLSTPWRRNWPRC